ncbi:MAG: class I SAM-dependent methyltransferase [Candidatus Heimdallarchaeota archaeon]
MENIPPKLASSGAIEIAEKLKTISGGKILDIAAGDGDFILTLINFLKNYESVIGIDTDENEIKKARLRMKNKPITIKKMKGEKLRYTDETFDLVSIANSLHHMQYLNITLSEMKRVLKNNGYFIIQEMFCDANQTEAQKCDTAAHILGAEIDSMSGIYHRKVFSRNEILNIVSQMGLKDLEILESTRYVKCLTCEEKYNCENPKNPELVNFALEDIDKTLEPIKEYKDYSEYRQRADTIKQRIKNQGSASASILFCIGKKED